MAELQDRLQDVIGRIPEETYFATCTEISESAFSPEGQINYQPDTRTYFEGVAEDEGVPGIIAAGAALLAAMIMLLGSCCVCCCSPRPLPQLSEFGKIADGAWWKRVLSFVLVGIILSLSAVVIAMSAWGIYETEDKVKVVVTRSFRLFEDTRAELERVDGNLTAVVGSGRAIINLVDRTATSLNNGEIPELEGISLDGFLDTTEEVERDIETISDVLEDEVRVYLDKLNEAIGYRDESDTADKVLRALLITSFLLMILFSLFVSIYAVFGRRPVMTIGASVIMWALLVLAFAFGVGFVGVARNVTEDSCLYMDDFSIEKVQEAVKSPEDDDRIRGLLQYYYAAPEAQTISSQDLQVLWNVPLDEVSQFLSTFGSLIVNPDGTLVVDPSSLSPDTQRLLGEAQRAIGEANRAVESVLSIIVGLTWRDLHKDLKDLVCCTVYDAVDGIWVSWVVTSVAASLLALTVTYQVIKSIWMAGPPTKINTRSPGQVVSAYAAVGGDKPTYR